MMNILGGPKTPPILQLIQWIADPIGFMESNAKRYGDIFFARLGKSLPLVFISQPKVVKEIFSLDSCQFDADESSDVLRILLGHNSIVLSNGAFHKRQRQLLMPPFHGSRIFTYGQLICKITQRVISNWDKGRPFSVRPCALDITMQVILQAVFGLQKGARYQELHDEVGAFLDMTASPVQALPLYFRFLQQDLGEWSPWGRFIRCRQKVDDLLYAEIRERRENLDSSRTDILTLLLSARDENGDAMTDEELRDELMTLLLAGHETTATALSWALYWIHKLPDVRSKLQAELDSLGTNLDPVAIFKLPYLTAVCQETLRIYPVLPVVLSRVAKFPQQILDYQLSTGTMVAPCIYLTHHREDIYPDPKRFRPERFIEGQYSPHEYLPFGGGNRRCIGMALAQYEMKLTIATILLNLELKLPNERPIHPVRRGVTLAPPDNLRLVVTGRRTPNPTSATAAVR